MVDHDGHLAENVRRRFRKETRKTPCVMLGRHAGPARNDRTGRGLELDLDPELDERGFLRRPMDRALAHGPTGSVRTTIRAELA